MTRFIAALSVSVWVTACAGSSDAPSEGPLTVTLGYHPLEGDVTATFVPLSQGQPLPVLMGGQGAVMCIVAGRLSGGVPDGSFTVDVALRKSNGDPWAFPRVRLEPIWSPDGTGYFANLWLIFADPPWIRPWEGTTARLELKATSLGAPEVVATAALDVVLMPSDAVAASMPPPEPDVPESLFEDTLEQDAEPGGSDTELDLGDIDWIPDIDDRDWIDTFSSPGGE